MIQTAIIELLKEFKGDNPEMYDEILKALGLTEVKRG